MPPRKEYTHEHQLQADCVIQFSHLYPELRGQLWGNFSEQSYHTAGKKKSLGLIAGLPDLFFRHKKQLVGIELKLPRKVHQIKHLKTQAEWMSQNCDIGVFTDSLEGFLEVINMTINVKTFFILNKCLHAQFISSFLDTLGEQKRLLWDMERIKNIAPL